MLKNWTRMLHGVIIFTGMSLAAVAVAAEPSPEGMTIEALNVAGNITLTRAEVLSVVRSRPGQAFSSEIADEDIRRIAKLDAVARAYPNTKIENGKIVLTYVVVEHNLVRSITFNGNETLKASVLTKELSFKRGDYLDAFAARADIDAIKEKYKKKGFPWARVSLDEGAVRLGQVAYIVEEGPRPKIAKVTFSGVPTL